MEQKVIIVEDTRNNEDKWAFLKKELEDKGIKVVRTKLLVGDYSLLNNMSVCIDTKKDLMEVLQNMHQDHKRFKQEAILAKESGIKLYILIIDEYIYNIEGVKYYKIPTYKGNQYKVINGVNVLMHKRGEPRSRANMETLSKAMKTFEERHNAKFVFTKKENCAKTILELLGVKL